MDALSKLTHGVYVLGAVWDGKNYGATVDAVAQQAFQPPIISVSCMNTGATKEAVEKSGRFTLSVLGEKCDPFVIANFGYQSSRKTDKWEKVPVNEVCGMPVLSCALAWFVCDVVGQEIFESHTVFFGRILETGLSDSSDNPLTYHTYQTKLKNKTMEVFSMNTNKKEVKWVCTVCGYVYDGKVPFEELPDDWVCPLCGVDKSFFEKKEV